MLYTKKKNQRIRTNLYLLLGYFIIDQKKHSDGDKLFIDKKTHSDGLINQEKVINENKC